jgi:transcriptional regulator of acetoin/glycerol metabolism
MGVDPGRVRLPHFSEPNEQADRLEKQLLAAAAPVLASLRTAIHDSSLFLTFTSKFGRNFYREGNRLSLRSADKIDLLPGASTDDDIIGTNGASTALRLKRGIIVDLNEHATKRRVA